jgi:outer membrane protein
VGTANKPLTAEEAAQIALKNNPSIGIAHGQWTSARGNLVSQTAALLPQITLSEGYTRQETLRASGGSGGTGSTGTTGGGGGRGNGFSGSATLNQLIFDFNHTVDLVRQQEALARSAQHLYTKAQTDAILLVKDAFYTYVQDMALVQVQQANVASAQASLDLAQASLNAGLGAPADVINARTTLANDIQQLLQARATAVTARTTFTQDMGIDPRTPFTASNSTEPAEPAADINTLVNQALLQRPDVLAADEQVRAAQFEVSAAKTFNAPNFNLQVSLTNSGPRDPLANAGLSGFFGVTWPLIDGGEGAGRTEAAHGDLEAAKEQLRQTTLAAIQDVSTAYMNVKTDEERVTVAATQVENATKNVQLAQGQYKAGVTPFVTVITAQAAQVQAESDQATAVANLAQARATLAHSLGH